MTASIRPTASDAHGLAHVFAPADPASPLAGVTVLALHGTGGDEHDLLPLARLVAPGAAVLSPRGPVLEHGMPRFFRRLAEGVFDLEDLAARTAQLDAFVQGATAAYGVDPTRVVAVGFSNGANIAASLLLRRPDALAGGVLLRAMVPFEPAADAAPVAPAGRAPVVALVAGRVDPIVPVAQPERLATLLRAVGADVRLEWVPAGHQLVQRDVEVGREVVAAVAGRSR